MPSQNNNNTVILVEGLSVKRGAAPVLQEITFEVKRGEMIGLIGPNGGGKTTLLQALLGLIKPSAGRILMFGLPAGTLGPVREKIGYIPQNRSYDRRFPLSAEDVVMTGCYSPRTLLRALRREEKEACREMLADASTGRAPFGVYPAARAAGAPGPGLVRRPELLWMNPPPPGSERAAAFPGAAPPAATKLRLNPSARIARCVSLAGLADRLLCINRTCISMASRSGFCTVRLQKAYRCTYDLRRWRRKRGRS